MLEHSNVRDPCSVEHHLDGWPRPTSSRSKDADTIMVISDGRDGDKFSDALTWSRRSAVAFIDRQMKRGCGLVTFHFTTFAPQKYAAEVLDWTGGYFQWEKDGKRDW